MANNLETPDSPLTSAGEIREPNSPRGDSSGRRLAARLSPRNIGAVYLLALLIIIFSIWAPGLFFSEQTLRNLLNDSAIPALAALALLIPLACGVFDLSFGAVIGFAGILCAWLLGHGVESAVIAALITLVMCLVIGLINALVVVVIGIDSFIGTLATGALVLAITTGISGNLILSDGVLASGLPSLAITRVFGLQLPVYFAAALMIVWGVLLEQTVIGRYAYASGLNRDAARLSGVPVRLVRSGSLVICSLVAGFAGIVLTAYIGTADPTTGPSYLIPAFAAVFAGATQFRGGRFNSWGTVLAVLLLGTGSIGLTLAGQPAWTNQVFLGAALITAVGVSVITRPKV